MIPPRPQRFAADLAPHGVEVKFVPFFADRKLFTAPPRLLLIHTNSARGEGTVQSAWNHSNARPNKNTLPHYQVDRDGRARKMCPSDRRGIANGTVSDETEIKRGDGTVHRPWPTLTAAQQSDILSHGNVQHWSLAIETADTGTDDDPTISAFTAVQAEVVAQIIAFESIVHGFRIEFPAHWHGTGVACHTEPATFPFWTINAGKTCPGPKKKRQMREQIMPRAQAIKDAWMIGTHVEAGRAALQGRAGTGTEEELDVNWNPTTVTVASVRSAPPVDDVLAGNVNDWAVIALIKSLQESAGLPVDGTYDQRTAEALNQILA